MPQYGRIQRTYQDSQGRPISGLNITVRKQGATVNGLHGGAHTSFAVNDPGGITSSPQDQLQVGIDTSVTRAVSSVAATTIVVGAAGFTDVADDARLTPTTNLPTLYNDAQGGETITQPLQTDANGEVVCWAPIVPYDLYTPGNANYAARLIQDVVPEGQEYVVSNIFPSASSVAFQRDTLRAQVSGSKLERWLSAGVEKFYIGLSAGLGPVLPAHTVTGTLTATGSLVAGAAVAAATDVSAGNDVVAERDLVASTRDVRIIAGILKFSAAASRIVPGATSLALRNNANSADNLLISDAGAATIRAGLTVTVDVAYRRHLANNGTTLVGADVALSAGWGDTALISSFGGSKDSRGRLQILCNGAGVGANPTVTITFKDGAYAVAPLILASRGDAVAPAGGYWAGGTPSTTQAAWTFVGTPVAGSTYVLQFLVIG
jgi:hypothetical protein